MKYFVLVALFLSVVCPAFAEESLPLTVAPSFAEADRFIRETARFGFSGQVIIAVDGKVMLNGAYGFADRGRRRPVTPSTTFGIASMSKMFTAAAILKAQEEGKLSLDDPIGKFLPDVPPERGPITLAQLLSHTSGIAAGFTNDFEDSSLEVLVNRIMHHPTSRKPGGAWSYASEGYMVLAAVLERATGMSYNQYVREKLIQPAGMKTTWFVGEHDPFGTLPAHAYNDLRDNGSPADWPVNARYTGAGSLVASASDLYRWGSALWGGRLLSPQSLELMLTKHASMGPDDDFGYGMFLWKTPNGALVQEHGGDTAMGFNGVVRWYPEKKTLLVITCNVMNVGSVSFRSAVQDFLVDWLETGKAFPPPAEAEWLTRGRALRIVGGYEVAGKPAAEILFDGTNAWLALEDQELLDAAYKATAEQSAVYRSDSVRASVLLAALRERDFAALDSALGADSSAREEMVDEWNKATESFGALLDFRILGTTRQGKTTRTFARLRMVNRDTTMILRWGDSGKGPLVSWNPRAMSYPMTLSLAGKGKGYVARDPVFDRGPWSVTEDSRGLTIQIGEKKKLLGSRDLQAWSP